MTKLCHDLNDVQLALDFILTLLIEPRHLCLFTPATVAEEVAKSVCKKQQEFVLQTYSDMMVVLSLFNRLLRDTFRRLFSVEVLDVLLAFFRWLEEISLSGFSHEQSLSGLHDEALLGHGEEEEAE